MSLARVWGFGPVVERVPGMGHSHSRGWGVRSDRPPLEQVLVFKEVFQRASHEPKWRRKLWLVRSKGTLLPVKDSLVPAGRS